MGMARCGPEPKLPSPCLSADKSCAQLADRGTGVVVLPVCSCGSLQPVRERQESNSA